MSEPLSSFATQVLGLAQQAVRTHNRLLPSGFAARVREASAGGPHWRPGSSQGVSPLTGGRALNIYFVQGRHSGHRTDNGSLGERSFKAHRDYPTSWRPKSASGRNAIP
jgi:hypothetical protein